MKPRDRRPARIPQPDKPGVVPLWPSGASSLRTISRMVDDNSRLRALKTLLEHLLRGILLPSPPVLQMNMHELLFKNRKWLPNTQLVLWAVAVRNQLDHALTLVHPVDLKSSIVILEQSIQRLLPHCNPAVHPYVTGERVIESGMSLGYVSVGFGNREVHASQPCCHEYSPCPFCNAFSYSDRDLEMFINNYGRWLICNGCHRLMMVSSQRGYPVLLALPSNVTFLWVYNVCQKCG